MDNASTDDTAEAALAAWPPDAPAALRVVREHQLGLGHAHARGFAEASGQLVTWVEDDNWIAPDWLELVSRTMEEHPEVGALGGFNEPVCEISPPPWLERFQYAYAAGPQGPARGDVTASRGFLWGAGLTVRKGAWDQLVGQGFRLQLPDRQGSTSFNSGGDSEICFALRLSGWRLWFEPRLRLRHFLPGHRLEWATCAACPAGLAPRQSASIPTTAPSAGDRTTDGAGCGFERRARSRPSWRSGRAPLGRRGDTRAKATRTSSTSSSRSDDSSNSCDAVTPTTEACTRSSTRIGIRLVPRTASSAHRPPSATSSCRRPRRAPAGPRARRRTPHPRRCHRRRRRRRSRSPRARRPR